MDTIQKFQDLLKKLFQFETSDLDFGIYRILNYKRDWIEKFIQEDLVNKVESAFAKHKDERLININQRFEDVKEKIIRSLGRDAFAPTGELKEQFKDTPLGRDYLSIIAQKDEAEIIDEIKLQVFNDLHNFFSRFYEKGDFVPQYRYSIKGHKYAIPYNGEEVKLYWANNEQYYTKTGLLFRDYTFKANNYKIIFRIVSAREELGSKKATKERFFILDDENPQETDNRILIIRFQYRELSEREVKKYQVEGGSNTSKQEKINQKTCERVLKEVKSLELKARLGKDYRNEKSLLLYQISRFSAKNTKDYFIHKNLKKFLCEQLDYFIKAEVLDIETLEKERFLDKHITRAKVVREIGKDIIDFLSQIEDFQKKLWEKKKFILKTEYVITTDRVPEEFYDEILKNKGQKKEWEDLGFDIPKTKKEMKKKKLPIDTRYFSQEFKEKLLEKLTECHSERSEESLDDLLDGLLIKSENYQALNLLLGKYKEKVQTIYIDPPFNLGTNADFLYNVNYKDSSWISILENRLQLARNLLSDKGSIFVRCDYNGNAYVRLLMNEVFREENFRNEMIINRTSRLKNEGIKYYTSCDSLFLYSKNQDYLFEQQKTKEPFEIELKLKEDIDKKKLSNFLKNSVEDFEYEIKGNKIKLKCQKWIEMHASSDKEDNEPITVFGKKIYPPKKRRWMWKDPDTIKKMEERGWIRINPNNGLPELLRTWRYLGSDWTDVRGYSQTTGFKTENSEELLQRIINTASIESSIVLDFFLGSGTTTAVAHKLGRKWIGVEMGEHFWTAVLPRMKKVLAYDKSGISKEKDVKEKYDGKTAGGFFKYHISEQYEDTLDNIELTLNKQTELKFGDDYLLKYFLDYETRGNTSLLNIEKLKNPFSYKLKVNLEEVGEPQKMIVDIPETFNYLLGLKVKKIKARNNPCLRADTHRQEKKYLFVLGEKEGKDIAIVWREYDDNWNEDDFKEDKEFIIKELEPWAPYTVYVNGQSVLTPKLGKHTAEIRYIEPEFKRLMEV